MHSGKTELFEIKKNLQANKAEKGSDLKFIKTWTC
jgi:hypothetical protein